MKWSRHQFTSHEEDCLDLGEVKIPEIIPTPSGYLRYDILSPVDRVVHKGQLVVIPTGLIADMSPKDEFDIPKVITRYFTKESVETYMSIESGKHITVKVLAKDKDINIRKGYLLSYIYIS